MFEITATKIQVSTKNSDRNTGICEKYRLKYMCPGTIPTEIHVSGDPTDKNIGFEELYKQK